MIRFIIILIEGFLIKDKNIIIKYMKKITILSIILITAISTSVFSLSQFVLARTNLENPSNSNHFTTTAYNFIPSNNNLKVSHNSFLQPISASGFTTELTSSFSNIISTQIYTGLNR